MFRKRLQDHSLVRQGLNREEIINAKKGTFNVCTAALIGVVALGILGALSLKAVVFLGALFLVGRIVAGQSLNRGNLNGIINQRLVELLDPSRDISFGGHVIFYNLL